MSQIFFLFSLVKVVSEIEIGLPKDFRNSKLILMNKNILKHDKGTMPCPSMVSFSSSQRNLIKTFQIGGMIALITKMTLIFSSDLLNGQKQLSKKGKFFINFRNKSHSILMLHKISKNKKCAPKLIFFNKKSFRKILVIFDVEN